MTKNVTTSIPLISFFFTKCSTYFHAKLCRNKRETHSYVEISASLGVDKPSDILFVTDVFQEATAAKAAGMCFSLILLYTKYRRNCFGSFQFLVFFLESKSDLLKIKIRVQSPYRGDETKETAKLPKKIKKNSCIFLINYYQVRTNLTMHE